jgi:hypothetical protein
MRRVMRWITRIAAVSSLLTCVAALAIVAVMQIEHMATISCRSHRLYEAKAETSAIALGVYERCLKTTTFDLRLRVISVTYASHCGYQSQPTWMVEWFDWGFWSRDGIDLGFHHVENSVLFQPQPFHRNSNGTVQNQITVDAGRQLILPYWFLVVHFSMLPATYGPRAYRAYRFYKARHLPSFQPIMITPSS